MNPTYDAVLVLSFGGPEGMDDVMPFLDNVLRGRGVPEARKLEVAEHYRQFGGVSPINAQNRSLITAMEQAMSRWGLDLPPRGRATQRKKGGSDLPIATATGVCSPPKTSIPGSVGR